jgi:dTDP-4-amino-4,6-dideoxygalactose transaminase
MRIPFNIPYSSGNEKVYVTDVINNSHKEDYINNCRSFLKSKWNCNEIYLTSSCTAALEVCALLLDIKPGDEVIVPSYTFPSTAIAFLRQGAKIVFADSRSDYPGIDQDKLESLITKRTKAIVPVHYGGIVCDMDAIMKVADKHEIFVVEDAATAFDSNYNDKPAGTIGHLGCLSFHETKNLQCGEGGAIIINDNRFLNRVISILDKGTNRNEFLTGTVERYEWVELGSAYLMSELHAAYLFAQLENADWIKEKRMSLWNEYSNSMKILQEKGFLRLPFIPEFANHNAHTFYIILNSPPKMEEMKRFLSGKNIHAAVHYTSLDRSKYWKENYTVTSEVSNSNIFNDCLLRLPLYNTMTNEEVLFISSTILNYYRSGLLLNV